MRWWHPGLLEPQRVARVEVERMLSRKAFRMLCAARECVGCSCAHVALKYAPDDAPCLACVRREASKAPELPWGVA